jgi:hypothetical protein
MAETDAATSTGSRSTKKRTAQNKKGPKKTRANGRAGLLALLQEDPLKVGAATLALGFVAGLVLPSTRKENELMGEQRERLLERAKEAGQEALDKGQRVVVQAVASVRKGMQEAAASTNQRGGKTAQ